MEAIMKPFFMTLAENGTHPPKVKHYDIEKAKAEAERLARTLGGKVHVLKCVLTCEKTDVRWERAEGFDDDIPF